jgi:uncharacterized protein (TIRG00374 family)
VWLFGLAFFVYLILRIGPGRIWEYISRLNLLLFLLLFLLRFILWLWRTINWKIIYEGYGHRIPLIRLFFARLAGHAVSFLTPSAQIGGEAVRTLVACDSNRKQCLASVIVDKTLEIGAVVLIAAVGLAVAISDIPMPRGVLAVFLVTLIVTAALVILLVAKQKKGLLQWLIQIIEKILWRFRFLEKHREKLLETDEYITNYYARHKGTLVVVFISHLFSLGFWIFEIYLTLRFLGAGEVGLRDSFLIVTLGTMAFLLPTIPAALGTYEATYVAIFALLGLGADLALTLTIIRRIIALIWAAVGLIVLAFKKK